jgi:hypothetical protein
VTVGRDERPSAQALKDRKVYDEYIPQPGVQPSQEIINAVDRVLKAERAGNYNYGRHEPQPPPDWKRDALKTLRVRMSLIKFIWYYQLANELGLTDSQVDQLNELPRPDEIVHFTDPYSLPRSEFKAYVARMAEQRKADHAAVDAAVEAILSTKQLTRLRQIAFQQSLFASKPVEAMDWHGRKIAAADARRLKAAVVSGRTEAMQAQQVLTYRSMIDGIADVVGQEQLVKKTGRLTTFGFHFPRDFAWIDEELNEGYESKRPRKNNRSVRR